MNVAEKLMTAEEFAQMPNDGKKYELMDGVPVEECRPKPIHGIIQARLTRRIGNFVEEQELGEVLVEAGVITKRDPDSVRGPDVFFVPKDQYVGHDLTTYLPGAPALAVEVVSEYDKPSDVDDKLNEYLAAGARQVWVVYPDTRRVVIYDANGRYKRLGINDTLEGGDVLPGFSLPLRDLFKEIQGKTP